MKAAEEYTEYGLFVAGIKPAYISELYEVSSLKQDYAFFILDESNYIFFQNDRMRNEFIDQIEMVEQNSPEYHRIIGESLGYPPQAVEFFAQCMRKPELREKRGHFHYAGMNFTGNVEQALEIAYWLWKNIRIPMAPVKIEYLGVKYMLSPNT